MHTGRALYMPGCHFSNRELVFLCRASVLDAERELYIPDVRVFFLCRTSLLLPGERFKCRASAIDTRRPLFLPGGFFFFYAGERFRCGADALHAGRPFVAGRALFILGKRFTCQVGSERAIFIPGEYFKYRSSGLHTGRAVYMPGGRFTYLTPSTTG